MRVIELQMIWKLRSRPWSFFLFVVVCLIEFEDFLQPQPTMSGDLRAGVLEHRRSRMQSLGH